MILAQEQYCGRDERIEIVDVDKVRFEGVEHPTHLPTSGKTIDSSKEPFDFSEQAVSQPFRSATQGDHLVTHASEVGNHAIHNGFLSAVSPIVIMYFQNFQSAAVGHT